MKLAFRQLLKSPGFAAVAILSLALAIGANTAIFSTLDAALLRGLPYPAADRLVQLWEHRENRELNSVSGGAFLDWREHQTTLEDIVLVHGVTFNLRDGDSPERVDGLEVTHEFLRVLGVAPLLGRGFLPADELPGGDNNVVLLTEELWRSRFASRSDVIGSRIVLDDVPRTVVGVVPAATWIHADAQFFVPSVLPPNTSRTRRDGHWASVFGRLKPDVTVEAAAAELNGVKQRLVASYPAWKGDWGVSVLSLSAILAQEARPVLVVLFAAVAVVLLIACANVANLLLARARERRQEIALRAALGAGGARLMRQVFGESLLLALFGGGLGLLFALWGIELLRHLTGDLLPRALAPSLDLRVLSFSLAVTLGTGLLFGLLPALHARNPDLNSALKSGGRAATVGGRQRSQSLLIIAEVALTVVLLSAAGLLLRSLVQTARVDLGFEPERAVAFDLALPYATYGTTEQRLAFSRQALERIRALPGVEAAGTALAVPFAGGGYGEYFYNAARAGENYHLGRVDYVSDGYLEALGARLLAGRTLTEADNRPDAARSIVINHAAARAVFPDENPLGQSMRIIGNDWKVVGVIADVPDRVLDRAPRPFAYAAQAFNRDNFSIVVRADVAPRSLTASIRHAIQQIDAGLPLANLRTLDEAMSDSLSSRRMILGLISAFAVVALVLASIGLFGVMAYSVALRRRELCIRLALGATPSAIRSLIHRDGLRLTVLGLLVGLATALATAHLISSLLFGVSPHDPLVLIGTVVLLAAVAIASCWLPALRASRSDPITALRAE